MRIDYKLQRVQVDSFEISDELVYHFFVSLPENERETALLRAIRIGVLATMEDRFSAFLSKTTDDLGVQLENLKLLFDMKQEVFHKSFASYFHIYRPPTPPYMRFRIQRSRFRAFPSHDVWQVVFSHPFE